MVAAPRQISCDSGGESALLGAGVGALGEVALEDDKDEGRRDGSTAVPYPASCRPQAWSAATAGVLMTAAVGLEVDVPGGVVRTDPSGVLPRQWRLQGVTVAGEELTLEGGPEPRS